MCGPTARNLFWGRKQAVCNNAGDTAALMDSTGAREHVQLHHVVQAPAVGVAPKFGIMVGPLTLP
jgi:hypothetical protein